MLITVAICTRNRAESLRRTLDSLAAMRVPDGLAWELVVVNNASEDDTDAVIASFADRLPVRRVLEPERGHSRARNRAIEAAQGSYIVWTDDDVIVDPGWLAAYRDAFQKWPDAAVFGGKIVPRYEPPVPKWVTDSERLLRHDGVFAGRDFGDEPLPLSGNNDHVPYGANFAIRGVEQRANRYDPDLGLGSANGRRRYADEVDVIERIAAAGGGAYWVPAARVEHCIERERQTTSFFFRYYAAVGETLTFRAARRATANQLWFGVPRGLWLRLFNGWLRYNIHRLISPAPVWVAHLRTYAMTWGAVCYWRYARAR